MTKKLRGAIASATGAPLFGDPLAALRALAARLNADQAAHLAAELARYRVGGQPVRSPVYAVRLLAEMAAAPACRALAD